MGQLGIYFGQQVKRLRVERGLSQAQLAETAGTSEEWIRRIERAARSPSFDTLEALSRALKVSVAKLFAGFGDEATDGRERLVAETDGFSRKQVEWLEVAARLLRRAPSR
ncbi:helix-turn-helix domain-containing protein [Sphingomonas dokdonensis]|uniref:HTH-type transcriptional regulator SinR n=1 Tax=Sphingomonas dokdonensis TaxID=344880 RepID=A0A245ZKX2_9SPHN|nr:helix-turn-helix transcriptional regulator [Sphingomonas dokdonensis]OWK30401.1 HTH-type transcriptional regulator SinR [Sphingomonas dokdonensis]